jgi:hypothetical protein
MAINGRAQIFIEPDDQYTTIVIKRDDATSGEELVSATAKQTLSAAFNKARDDLGALAAGGLKHRHITITTRVD